MVKTTTRKNENVSCHVSQEYDININMKALALVWLTRFTSRHSTRTSCRDCGGSGRFCCPEAPRCWRGAGWAHRSRPDRLRKALSIHLPQNSHCAPEHAHVPCSEEPGRWDRSLSTRKNKDNHFIFSAKTACSITKTIVLFHQVNQMKITGGAIETTFPFSCSSALRCNFRYTSGFWPQD